MKCFTVIEDRQIYPNFAFNDRNRMGVNWDFLELPSYAGYMGINPPNTLLPSRYNGSYYATSVCTPTSLVEYAEVTRLLGQGPRVCLIQPEVETNEVALIYWAIKQQTEHGIVDFPTGARPGRKMVTALTGESIPTAQYLFSLKSGYGVTVKFPKTGFEIRIKYSQGDFLEFERS